MWPNVPLLSRFLLTFNGVMHSQTILNTFWYQVKSLTGAEKPLDQLTQAFFADLEYVALESDFLACLPETYSLRETWFQQITPTRQRKGILERALDGGIAAQGNVTNIAAVISRHGTGASRHDNGRIHLPVPSGTTYIENGLLTAAHKVTLQLLADQMLQPISVTVDASVYELVPILAWRINEAPFWGSLEVESTNVQDTSRVMRRRTLGLGI